MSTLKGAAEGHRQIPRDGIPRFDIEIGSVDAHPTDALDEREGIHSLHVAVRKRGAKIASETSAELKGLQTATGSGVAARLVVVSRDDGGGEGRKREPCPRGQADAQSQAGILNGSVVNPRIERAVQAIGSLMLRRNERDISIECDPVGDRELTRRDEAEIGDLPLVERRTVRIEMLA